MTSIETIANRLAEALESGEGIHALMRADEAAAGRKVVVPGDVPWLPAEDWDPTIVVSIDGRRVRLVAILAKNPGNGAFRRLVAAIEAAGLEPTIVCPTNEMRATVKRWGWKRRDVGRDWNHEELWYPRR